MRLVWSVITISLFVVLCTQAKRNFRLRKHHLRSRQDIEKQESRNEDRGEEDRNVTKVYDTVHKYHGKKRHSTSAKRHDLGLLSGLDQAHLGGGDHHMNGLNGVATADVGANADSPSVGYLDAAHGITAALHGQKLQVGGQAMPAHHPEEEGLNPLSVYHKRDPVDHTQDSNVAGFVDNHAISLSANGHTVDGHTLNSEIGDQTLNIPTSTTAGHALGGHVGGLVGHVSDGNMQIADDTVVSSPHLETSAQSQQLSAAQEGGAWLQHQQGTMNVAHPEGTLLHSDHHTSHNLGTVGHIGTFGHIDTVGHIDTQPQAIGHHVENYMQGSEELEHHLAYQRPIVISHPPIHITKNHHHHTFHDVEDQGTVEYHPCINGGVYVPTSAHSYECICPEQYIGKNCQDMNHCHPCPCKNKGRCHNIADLPKYKCTCPAGFYGQQCAMKDPCHPNPCKNNGKCAHDGKGNIECVCPLRFKGTRCEDLHSCKPNPCLNSGMCLEKDGKGKFECQCTEQYRGTICSKSRFCYQNPCQNGGVCQEDHDNFNCICIHGWRGRICEERACKPNPCKNGATCSETADGKDFKCICLPWHSGRLCEENRPCLTKPCMNGGKCIDSFSGFHWSYGPLQFYCICKAPYTGERCEIHGCRNCHKNAHCESDKCVCDEGYTGNGKTCIKKADPCHPNPCENEGICVQKGETEEFECKCKKPYLPPYCKLRDVCDPNPCKNEAQCVPGGDGSYTCVCPPGFKGPDCDKTDACLPNPCQHGGTCRDENGTAKCECKGAWAPPLCKECSCPKKNLPGVPDITCDSEGKCVCPPGFIMDILMKICKKEKKGGGSPCTSTPCINGGECLDQGSTYVCRCKPPYLGKDCQIKDPCNPNPCNNNGKCKSDKATGKFLGCDCPPKFPVQPFCDLKDVPVKGVCEPNPCKNAGRCMPAGKSYDCICTDRFTGPTCAIDKCANCDENAACMGGKCKCKAGFIGNGYECIRDTPTCEQKCPQYSTCVIPTGNCQCNPGYTFVDRICLPLSSGEGEEETSETVKPTEKPTVTDEPMTTAAASTVPLTKDNSGGGGQPITTNPATIKPTTIPITKPTGGSPIPPKTNPTSKPPAPTEEGQGAEPNMGNKPPPQAPQPTSLPQTKPSPATPTPPPKGPPAPPPSNSKGGSPSGPPGPPGSSSSSSGGPPAPPSSSSSSGGSPGPPGSSKGGAAPPGAKPSEESGSPAPPSGLKAGSAGPPGGSKGGSAGPPGPPGSSSAGAAGPPGPPSGSKGGSPGPPGPPGSSTKSFIKNKYRQRLLNDNKTGQDDNSEFDFAIR